MKTRLRRIALWCYAARRKRPAYNTEVTWLCLCSPCQGHRSEPEVRQSRTGGSRRHALDSRGRKRQRRRRRQQTGQKREKQVSYLVTPHRKVCRNLLIADTFMVVDVTG